MDESEFALFVSESETPYEIKRDRESTNMIEFMTKVAEYNPQIFHVLSLLIREICRLNVHRETQQVTDTVKAHVSEHLFTREWVQKDAEFVLSQGLDPVKVHQSKENILANTRKLLGMPIEEVITLWKH